MSALIYIHGTSTYPFRPENRRGLGRFSCISASMGESEKSALIQLSQLSNPVVYTFYWSGGDTHRDRVESGYILSTYLKALEPYHEEMVLVGFSHGGNVAGHAMNNRVKQKIHGVYLFACPIMTGENAAWNTNNISRVGRFYTFSHPYDSIQVMGSAARNSLDRTATGRLNYSVDFRLPSVRNVSISPPGYSAHLAMRTAIAFDMAYKKTRYIHDT